MSIEAIFIPKEQLLLLWNVIFHIPKHFCSISIWNHIFTRLYLSHNAGEPLASKLEQNWSMSIELRKKHFLESVPYLYIIFLSRINKYYQTSQLLTENTPWKQVLNLIICDKKATKRQLEVRIMHPFAHNSRIYRLQKPRIGRCVRYMKSTTLSAK